MLLLRRGSEGDGRCWWDECGVGGAGMECMVECICAGGKSVASTNAVS